VKLHFERLQFRTGKLRFELRGMQFFFAVSPLVIPSVPEREDKSVEDQRKKKVREQEIGSTRKPGSERADARYKDQMNQDRKESPEQREQQSQRRI
jgi:hypothetical protein